jgi:hypothetical protein
LSFSRQTEEYEVDLNKLPPNGYYEVSAAKDKIYRPLRYRGYGTT